MSVGGLTCSGNLDTNGEADPARIFRRTKLRISLFPVPERVEDQNQGSRHGRAKSGGPSDLGRAGDVFGVAPALMEIIVFRS